MVNVIWSHKEKQCISDPNDYNLTNSIEKYLHIITDNINPNIVFIT